MGWREGGRDQRVTHTRALVRLQAQGGGSLRPAFPRCWTAVTRIEPPIDRRLKDAVLVILGRAAGRGEMDSWPPSAEAVLPRRAPIGAGEAMASSDALVLLTVGKSATLFADAVLVILEKESWRVDRLVADAVLVIPRDNTCPIVC